MGVTQGVHVRPILVDPCVYLISSADGPVAGDENPAFLNQQRRIARGMRLMLDNPDLRAIPRNLRHLGGQAGNEAEQVQRYCSAMRAACARPSDSRSRAVAAQRAVP